MFQVVTVIPEPCERSTRVTTRSVPEYKQLRMRAMLNAEKAESSKAAGGLSHKSSEPSSLVTSPCNDDVKNLEKVSLFKPPYCNVKKLTCLLCSTKYSSMKTLKIHMTSIHAERRKVFPCTECRSQFVHCWGAVRHLVKVHQKKMDDIGELRDMIKQRASFKNIFPVSPMRHRDHKCSASKDEKDVMEDEEMHQEMSGKDESVCKETSSEVGDGSVVGKEERQTAQITKMDTGETNSENAEGLDLSSVCVGSLVLHKCAKCNKMFGHKETLLKHQDVCNMESAIGNAEALLLKGKSKGKRPTKDRIEPIINCEMPLDPTDWDQKLMAHIDRIRRKCLLCGEKYCSLSNTKRHVQLHLGWKRFECKLCGFQNFNRGDIRSHLCRSHEDKLKGGKSVDKFILDLVLGGTAEEPAAPTRRMPIQSRNACPVIKNQSHTNRRKSKPTQHTVPTTSTSEYSIKYRTTSQSRAGRSPRKSSQPQPVFNISTRRTPRTFDLTPCTRSGKPTVASSTVSDRLTTLQTRSGTYIKRPPPKHVLQRMTERNLVLKKEEICPEDSEDAVYAGKKVDNGEGSSKSGKRRFSIPTLISAEPGVFVQSDSLYLHSDKSSDAGDTTKTEQQKPNTEASKQLNEKDEVVRLKRPKQEEELSDRSAKVHLHVSKPEKQHGFQLSTCRVSLQRSPIAPGKQQLKESRSECTSVKTLTGDKGIKPLAAVHQATAAWLQARAAAQRCVTLTPRHAQAKEPPLLSQMQLNEDQQAESKEQAADSECSGMPSSSNIILKEQLVAVPEQIQTAELDIKQNMSIAGEVQVSTMPEANQLSTTEPGTVTQQHSDKLVTKSTIPVELLSAKKESLVTTTSQNLQHMYTAVKQTAFQLQVNKPKEQQKEDAAKAFAQTTLVSQPTILTTQQSSKMPIVVLSSRTQPIMTTQQLKDARPAAHPQPVVSVTQLVLPSSQAVRKNEKPIVFQGKVSSPQYVIRTSQPVPIRQGNKGPRPIVTFLPGKQLIPVCQQSIPVRQPSLPVKHLPGNQKILPIENQPISVRQQIIPTKNVEFSNILTDVTCQQTSASTSQSVVDKQQVSVLDRHNVCAERGANKNIVLQETQNSTYLPPDVTSKEIMSNAELATFPEQFILDSTNQQLSDKTEQKSSTEDKEDSQHMYVDLGDLVNLDDVQYIVTEEVIGE